MLNARGESVEVEGTLMIDPKTLTSETFATYTFHQVDEALKRWDRQQLAEDLVEIVGLRHEKDGKRYMCLRDVDAHKDEIIRLLPRVVAAIKWKQRASLSAATNKQAHRNIGSSILRAAGRLGERIRMNTKEERKWYSCGNWQVLPRSSDHQ